MLPGESGRLSGSISAAAADRTPARANAVAAKTRNLEQRSYVNFIEGNVCLLWRVGE